MFWGGKVGKWRGSSKSMNWAEKKYKKLAIIIGPRAANLLINLI
jgi:hypothetical protein